jgi:hypothetical protein
MTPEGIYSPENVPSEFVMNSMKPKLAGIRFQGCLIKKTKGVENNDHAESMTSMTIE